MSNETIRRPHGQLVLWILRHGIPVERWIGENLVVAAADSLHARLLGGATAGNSITQVGYGSGASPAASGNTALTTPYVKNVDSVAYPRPGQVAFAISLASFEANGTSISEFGLFAGNGTLFCRLVRASPLLKDSSTTISAIWTIDYTEQV